MQTNATLLANNSQHYWMLHVVSVCTSFCMLLGVVGSCCVRLYVATSREGHLGLIVIYLFKAYARNTTTEAPSTSIRFCLKTEIFSRVWPTARADPGFFLGGGALVSCSVYFNTNKPHSFFLQNTSCIRKPQVISGGGGAPPAPSP